MPQSRVALAESLSDTLASLQTARSVLSNAWALRMSASQKAHFAAVMGNSLTRNCREQGWIVEAALREQRDKVEHFYLAELERHRSQLQLLQSPGRSSRCTPLGDELVQQGDLEPTRHAHEERSKGLSA